MCRRQVTYSRDAGRMYKLPYFSLYMKGKIAERENSTGRLRGGSAKTKNYHRTLTQNLSSTRTLCLLPRVFLQWKQLSSIFLISLFCFVQVCCMKLVSDACTLLNLPRMCSFFLFSPSGSSALPADKIKTF